MKQALFLITEMIVSLWAASIVASRMSRRMIFQDELGIRATMNWRVTFTSGAVGSIGAINTCKKVPTAIVIAVELAIGLTVVGLKVYIGH